MAQRAPGWIMSDPDQQDGFKRDTVLGPARAGATGMTSSFIDYEHPSEENSFGNMGIYD